MTLQGYGPIKYGSYQHLVKDYEIKGARGNRDLVGQRPDTLAILVIYPKDLTNLQVAVYPQDFINGHNINIYNISVRNQRFHIIN